MNSPSFLPFIPSMSLLGRRFTWSKRAEKEESTKTRRARESFEEKLTRGEYRFQELTCFCGGGKDQLLSSTDRQGLYYPLVVCEECGLVRAHPCLSEKSFKAFYDCEYRPLYGDEDTPLPLRLKEWVCRAEETFDFLKPYLPVKGRVLDVGCNTGALLLPFHRAGWRVFGVDHGSAGLDHGRRVWGLDTLWQGGIERFLETGEKVDLVTMNHVFEHMLDLESELAKVQLALNEEGLLYISVPGTFDWITAQCGGNILYLLQNAHVHQFSLKSLSYVLECCGFECLYGDEKIRALFRRSPIRRSKGIRPQGEAKRVKEYLLAAEKRYLPKWYVGRILEFLGLKRIVNRCRRFIFR